MTPMGSYYKGRWHGSAAARPSYEAARAEEAASAAPPPLGAAAAKGGAAAACAAAAAASVNCLVRSCASIRAMSSFWPKGLVT